MSSDVSIGVRSNEVKRRRLLVSRMSKVSLSFRTNEAGQAIVEDTDREEIEAVAESDLPASVWAKILLMNWEQIESSAESD